MVSAFEKWIANDLVSFLVNLHATHGGPTLLHRRLIALHPGEEIVLGRSSQNKRDLAAKATNGFFDNPVISRNHAVLTNRNQKVPLSSPSHSDADNFQIVIIDQNSTHGTYLNSEQLAPYNPKIVQDGDVITLGTKIEPRSSCHESQHLPTTIHLGIVKLPYQAENGEFTVDQMDVAPKAPSTNSFHPPESDSEEDERPTQAQQTPMTWKPFADMTSIALISETKTADEFQEEMMQRALSASTSSSAEKQGHAVVDLTLDSDSWHAEPIDIITVNEDDEPVEEKSDDEEDPEQDDYESEEELDPQMIYIPYRYDTEDKESVNGETQIPETPHVEVCPTYIQF